MSSQLCTECSKIPFDSDLKTMQESDGIGPWHLGTFGRVRARNCPFCELVASICVKAKFSWESSTPSKDSENVIVHWTRHGLTVKSPPGCNSYICIAALNDFIDLDEIRRWISTRHQGNTQDLDNPDLCSSTPFNPAILPTIGKRQLDFRVIDVDTMSIVYAPLRCKYIALSYVWGTKQKSKLVLTSHNEEDLMQPGALESARASIPNTILDTITVVRGLQERYLWVDSLCLVQDDATELQECVSIMDMFYEMAIFTIMAADGEDAWAGLQGIAPTPRQMSRPVREIVPGLKLTTVGDLETLLRKSAYSTRAWTMQEEVISRRHLVFIDGQVYYRCGCAYYSEALNQSGKPLHNQISATGSVQYGLLKYPTADFSDFATMIMYYMMRRLSFQTDILRAAQGMLRKFSVISGLHCFEGLPPPLGRSLLFFERIHSPSQRPGRREGFPSYSWTGWKNVPIYDDELEWINEISNDRSIEDDFAESKSGLRVWIIWHCRLEDGNLYRISDTGRLRKRLLLNPEDSQHKARRRFRELSVSVSDVDFRTVRASSYPLLLFWTICINLQLKRLPQNSWNYPGFFNYQAINKYGESCGVVRMDTFVSEIMEGKFALLAANGDSFWALMLMWEDGIAERRGVVILPSDIINSCLPPGPRWKAVVLG